eukprot:scaffold120819_cov72-Phaeocystis_antarctica.AAC.1
MSLIGQAEELRCEGHLERGVCEGARDGVHRGIRVVARRQGEVRVVLAPRHAVGKERCHPATSLSTASGARRADDLNSRKCQRLLRSAEQAGKGYGLKCPGWS